MPVSCRQLSSAENSMLRSLSWSEGRDTSHAGTGGPGIISRGRPRTWAPHKHSPWANPNSEDHPPPPLPAQPAPAPSHTREGNRTQWASKGTGRISVLPDDTQEPHESISLMAVGPAPQTMRERRMGHRTQGKPSPQGIQGCGVRGRRLQSQRAEAHHLTRGHPWGKSQINGATCWELDRRGQSSSRNDLLLEDTGL